MSTTFLRRCLISLNKASQTKRCLKASLPLHNQLADKHTHAEQTISSRVTLNDGHTMPIFGLGSWAVEGVESYEAVVDAANVGYRLIDTAQWYNNERMVGKALAETGLPRDDYFVVTKLSPDLHGYDSAKVNLAKSLELLGLNYVDLFLIHSPHGGSNVETWRAFTELKGEGLTRSIGVSNYNIHHVERLLAEGLELPAVNQFELHPWNQYPGPVRYCREKGITVMGYCPLARCQYFDTPKCAHVDVLCEKYGKTRAQVRPFFEA